MLRIFSLVIPLALLGCDSISDSVSINIPTLNSPTYLNCTADNKKSMFIIVDHANELWITYDYWLINSIKMANYIVEDEIMAIDLKSDDDNYWGNDGDYNYMGVNRKTLVYGEGNSQRLCTELEEKDVPTAIKETVRNIAIERNTNKI